MSAKILIVDDEKNVRLNYRIALETEGYQIFEAVSAANALEELVARSFDLAILDMRMPAMDGLQLLAKMREVKIHGPGDDRHGLQRCAARGAGDEAGSDRLFAKASPA